MSLTIGVDVGGTKVAAGLVDEKGTILASVRRPTPSTSPAAVADTIAAVVAQLRTQAGEQLVEAVGVGAAGFVDRDRATVLFAPNLAWRQEPLRDKVSQLIGLPVVVENDANATAWAEFRFGAGVAADELVCITVGTGIGGGLVLDGAPYRGSFGVGAEVGHMQVVPDGHRCGCGQRGCWEQYASGRALVREARDIATTSPVTATRLLELGGGEADGINGPEVTRAAREGDPAALECFEVVGHWLGQGLADLAAVLDPRLFVIGGGVSEAEELLLGPARESFRRALTGHGRRPEATIVPAELGAAAGLVGAADLARQR
jgi:glucokinase